MKRADLRSRARAVGIPNDDSWPYGPNVHVEMREPLVKWAEQNGGLRYSPIGKCLHWIARGRCGVATCGHGALGALDHVTGWLGSDGTPKVLLAQPYWLHPEAIRELESACHEIGGIGFRILPPTWYGHDTIAVVISRETQFPPPE